MGERHIADSEFAQPYPVRPRGHAWGAWLLRRLGWRVHFDGLPTQQGVLLVYPHTSNWDFVMLVLAKWALGLHGGVVVANPVPKESEIDSALISRAIEQALAESLQKGISGKETTPFLLAKVKDITEGKSLETNIALVKNNARVAADIAVAMTEKV